jgi:uncharacterized repeat protein (TIGR02543 family)
MTSVYDGKDPNVDFVLTYGFQADNTGSFAVSSIYSTDAGETWQVTESVIKMKAEGVEGGVSESALIELEDGTLYTVMRAQAESNDYYYASYSYDYGKTWDETPTATNILTTNTMPVLDRYDGNLLLLWQGNNTMGGKSYKRFPLNVSYSADDGVTWEKILDLSLGTSLQIPAEIRLTQSDITFANYKGERDAVIVWNNMEGLVGSLGDTATAMQVENFEEYLYKTQGAFDSFQSTNARNEGWVQLVVPPFSFDISSEQAAEGSQSMKLAGKGSNTMVSRNVPSMKSGTVAYSLYLPEDFSTTLYTEFKAAYNNTLNKNAVVSFYMNADGELCSKMIGKPANVHTTLTKGEWHDIEVVFDTAAKTSMLYVDGEACGSLAINPGAQVATVALTLASESSVYIDNFRATAANKYATPIVCEVDGESAPYTVTFIVDNETYAEQTATTGGAITLPSNPTKDGYTFKGWYTAVSGGTEVTEFTSTMTVYAQWTKNIEEPETPPSTPTPTPTPTPVLETKVEEGQVTTTIPAKPTTDANGKAVAAISETQLADAIAKAAADAAKQGKKIETAVKIDVSAPADAKTAGVNLTAEALTRFIDSKADTLAISTPFGTMTFDEKTAAGILKQSAGTITITATKVETTELTAEIREKVGDRPVVSFDITGKDKAISQLGGNATVTIPYVLKASEKPNAIVVYYINSAGKLEAVRNCKYDTATGTITFKTPHFSQYAVGYNKVEFSDVADSAWYGDAVTFAAAREITAGVGTGNSAVRNFGSNETVTRAQALVMIMKAFGIDPDENAENNFIDAGNSYYTGYLAAAKNLGITSGVGDNKFAPDKQVARQELFVLIYTTLKIMNELPTATIAKDLTEFKDAGNVADYANKAIELFVKTGIISGTNGNILPAASASRAQFVQILYNIIKH